MKKKDTIDIWEDVWIPTQCGRCYCACAIQVRRVNGTAIEIQGNPGSTMGGEGAVCPKGLAGLQVLYDPNRLNVPLRRTNPEKGLYADPRWKEITWDEALNEIVPKLTKIYNDNPRKLLIMGGPIRPTRAGRGALGGTLAPTNMFLGGGGLHCGNGAHPVGGMVHAAWSIVPDFKYCNYVLLFGASKGHAAGHSALVTARLAAEARARGMKMVVFDPMCNFTGGKATDWVPIIPGTDAAVILAMCNIIINELGIYDKVFLKAKTNAPYLIGPDLKYIRETGPGRGVKGHSLRGEEVVYIGDDETNKALVWDAIEGKAKAYDDPTIKDYALEGEYQVNGVKCSPAFQLLKEHLKSYTPEMASEASTVPASTIHSIAADFAHAAQVGSTITIDGHQLPFRPASAVLFRGGEGHENSFHTCFAVALLNQIVGAADVPGGTLGWPARSLGFPGTGQLNWSPFKGIDGFLACARFGPSSGAQNPKVPPHGPWPIAMPTNRHELSLNDIFPIAPFTYIFAGTDQDEIWSKTKAPYRIEMAISSNINIPMSMADADAIADALKKIPFLVSFELFNTEMTEGFADIVLPDCSYLEETTWSEGLGQNFNHAFGMEDWCYHIVQPVVEPVAQRRNIANVYVEILDRMGLTERNNERCNRSYPIGDEYRLGPTDKATGEELASRVVKTLFGPEHDWEYFKKHGFIRWPKRVEEAYWRYFVDARTAIYLEFLVHMGEKLKEIRDETGLDIDLTQYTPFISWFPCSIHKVRAAEEYDLYCFSYRDVLHTGSSTMEQPWLDEASRINPYTYNITMNVDTAKKKGLKDGDMIEIETYQGRKVTGPLKLMLGQHPQVVGIAACSGHWAKGQPIARGKGVNFDTLLPVDLQHMDPVSQNIETAVRVKVS